MFDDKNESPPVVLRGYQEEMVEKTVNNLFKLKHRGTVNVAPMGCGKCHARGTLIMMHDGSAKAVEKIVVGDLVMGVDSSPRKVLSTTSGYGEMFKVSPIKGDSYTVNADHVLSLKMTKGYNLGSKSAVNRPGDVINISVRDFIGKSKWFRSSAKGYKVGVNFPAACVFDPYLLGVWLGDGSSTRPEITTADHEIVKYISTAADRMGLRIVKHTKPGNRASTYSLSGLSGRYFDENCKNEFLQNLRRMNLIGNKHIPDEYKTNSRDVRLAVLAGIIDTDGYLARNYYDVVFKSERLARDVMWLARSLGFASYVKECHKKCCNNGVVGSYFRVGISGNVDEIPVLIERKRASARRQKKDVLVSSISVSSVGYGDYFGFDIDGDHLYLMADFTVTHNSLTMAKTAKESSDGYGVSVLILAHFKNLVKQNKKAVQRLGRECFIYHGEEKDIPSWSFVKKNAAIVSAGVAAIIHALQKIPPDTFQLILIDEGHHATVGSAFDTIRKHFNAPIATYTATPDRPDNLPLVGDKALCESVAFNGHVRDFVRDGWILRPVVTFEKSVKLNYSVLPTDGSRITEKQAEAVWEANKSNYAVIKPFLEKCGLMQAIGFAPTVRLAKLWSHLCNEDRPGKSEYVASYKPGDYTDGKFDFDGSERRLIESRFESGQTQYLWNQGCYLEGADLVAAVVCMLGMVTDSRTKLAQAIGRVLRPCNRSDGLSILTGYERATAAERLAVIAASAKPEAIVLDYGGSTGPLKLTHPIDLYQLDGGMEPKLRERVINRMDELAERGEDRISLEEVMLEQEEAYKKFLVRDARIRKSLAVECEVLTRDIDPFGPPEVAGHQRYTAKKINPPPAGVVDRIRKLTRELGKKYSEEFYSKLGHAQAFVVVKQLQAQADSKRKGEPCPQWIYDILQSRGDYGEYQSEYHGRMAMIGRKSNGSKTKGRGTKKA